MSVPAAASTVSAPAVSAPQEDSQVAAYWRALGLPGLVDLHVHFLPSSMQAKVWSYFDRAESHYGRPWPVRYAVDEATRVELLRSFGVLAFPTHPYPHKPGMARWLNEWSRDFARRTPGCVQTATLFPEESVLDDVTAALDDGARMMKVHVQVGGFDPLDPLLDPVWGLLAEVGLPVTIHCGSAPIPGTFTGPRAVEAVLRRHPRLTLVIAHMGMNEYVEHLSLTDRYPRVYLDTTMFGTDFTESFAPMPDVVPSMLADRADRIVLGTDFPTIPYAYAHQLEALHRLDLGEDWLRGVLHDNGARLLGLSSVSEPA